MKINKLIITLIAAAFIFMGCSNSLDSAPSATGSYSVTGKISFASSSGAAPIIFTQDSEGRTATASFNNVHLSLKLYAYKYNEEGRLQTNKKYDNVVVDQSGYFVFCFEEKGFYILCADLLKDGIKSGTGFTEVEVTGYTPNTINIVTNPVITEDGKIQLNVSVATDITPQIKRVSVSWIRSVNLRLGDNVNPLDPTGEQRELEIRRNDSVQDGKYNKSFDVINGTATISYDNFPGGNWLAKISFEDETGNSLYSCQEIINVYPGFTTNRWYGSTPALNNGTFKITKSMVTNYDAIRIPSTDYVLYNYEQGGAEVNGEKKYNYYLVSGDELENSLPSPAVTSLAVGDSASIKDARCFDSEGNLYLLQLTFNYENSIALESTKTEWTAPNMKQKLGINFAYESNIAITSDFETNKFYIFLIDQDADTTIAVNCYPEILSSNGATTTKLSKSLDFGGGSISSYHFAVNNDTLYMLSTSQGVSNPYTLRVYDLSLLSGDDSSINYSKSISIDLLSILGVDDIKGEISDMLYQNECLYMLYKEVSNYDPDPDIYSRGGVIQYNLLTGSTLFKGFTSNCIAKDSGYSLQAMTRDTYGNQYLLYMDATGNEPFVPDVNKAEKYPDIYVPGENESSFYGPTKFIAIKPKQLVISDEGFAYYTYNGLLYRKNINRVAIVNLEDFAIVFKNINPTLSMEIDYTGNLINTGSVGLDAADVYYKKDGDNYTAFSSDCCYLGVITE